MDENNHRDRCKTKEENREEVIKKETGFEIIRINPDTENFDIFDEIGKIQSFIIDSTKKITEELTKNYMINDAEKLTKMLKLL